MGYSKVKAYDEKYSCSIPIFLPLEGGDSITLILDSSVSPCITARQVFVGLHASGRGN